MNKKLKKRIENKLERYIEERGIDSVEELDIGEFIKENMTRWNKEYTNNKDLRDYLDYIKKFKVLSKEEQITLFNDYKKGNKKSFTKLINHNLRLPVSIAQNFIDNTNATINVFDLINEGNLALVKATKRFDPSKDVKFSSFATIMIKQGIFRFVLENEKSISIKYSTKLVINKVCINLFCKLQC